jgi:hypothetical protein
MQDIKKVLAKVVNFEDSTKRANHSNTLKITDKPTKEPILIKSFSK